MQLDSGRLYWDWVILNGLKGDLARQVDAAR